VIGRRSPAYGSVEFDAVLDPETQPCYAADMPDTDSRPLAASPNDLSVMSCLHVTPLHEVAVAHRFAEYCNEFCLVIGFRATFGVAETLLLSEFDRGPPEDSVINALSAASRLVEMHGFLAAAIAAGPVTSAMCRIP